MTNSANYWRFGPFGTLRQQIVWRLANSIYVVKKNNQTQLRERRSLEPNGRHFVGNCGVFSSAAVGAQVAELRPLLLIQSCNSSNHCLCSLHICQCKRIVHILG